MIRIYVTSAFSKDNAGGNKAGVVLNHPELTAADKMAISKALCYSETAFVNASERADYKLEYFTPTEEVPLCGHATIATFATLKLLGMIEKEALTIETKAGLLSIHVDADGLVMMEQNKPQYLDIFTEAEVAPSFGSSYKGIGEPIQTITTGLKDIILPVASEDELAALEPDFPVMTEFSRIKDVVGFHAFTVPCDKPGVDAVCRNFAPLYGINEESATGTASCALAGYFYKYIRKQDSYTFEQGYSLNLPSKIVVRLEHDGNEIRRIFVGGYGYLVEEKEM